MKTERNVYLCQSGNYYSINAAIKAVVMLCKWVYVNANCHLVKLILSFKMADVMDMIACGRWNAYT